MPLCDSQTFLHTQLSFLENFVEALKHLESVEERISFVRESPAVIAFLQTQDWFEAFLAKVSSDQELALLELIAVGQEEALFFSKTLGENREDLLFQLAHRLEAVEHFYFEMGGVAGYQLAIVRLLLGESSSPFKDKEVRYLPPQGVNLALDSALRRRCVLKGLRSLSKIAEIYVVGGAGDRLAYCDQKTGEALPVALFQFAGPFTLLEGLIRDLQAKEYLHYKLYGESILTPVGMMTSEEKNNHSRILALCEEKQWFYRPRESFFLFEQPQVPVVLKTGYWAVSSPLTPIWKPGGHGVLWKLAEKTGLFSWLTERGYTKLLIRQINNPVAGVDDGLLGFTGAGILQNKQFGFASCERRSGSPEGMNVHIEAVSERGIDACLTNIEYTEFEKHGLSEDPQSAFSAFPANTNILFADITSVRKALLECLLPGMLLNLKSKFPALNAQGESVEIAGGRLEGTMQNIADYLTNHSQKSLPPEELKTYVTFNERIKTLSVVKKAAKPGESQEGTPQMCFREMRENYHRLLVEHCGMELPEKEAPFVIHMHPALGPLYSIISQKISKGKIYSGALLELEIAELKIEDLELEGALRIHAEFIMGHLEEGLLKYSDQVGKCQLQRVRVKNRGLIPGQDLWSGKRLVEESLEIYLKGSGEFYAKDVVFEGNIRVEVEEGERVTAFQEKGGKVSFKRERLQGPSWSWSYSVTPEDRIECSQKKL